jgi:transposase-like protein
MSDMQCPYCGADQQVCHDDGHGYAEDVRHEHECTECEKSFVFTTRISFDYTPHKADCLNDAPHNLEMSGTFPRKYSRMRCTQCDYDRQPTAEEFAAHGITAQEPTE